MDGNALKQAFFNAANMMILNGEAHVLRNGRWINARSREKISK